MKKNTPLSQLTQADEMKQSDLERSFVTYWRQFGGDCPEPLCNYVFLPDRKFELDFAWPDARVGVECQGLKDHGTAKGINRDAEKKNLANLERWVIFEVTTRMLERDPKGFVLMVAVFVRDRMREKMREDVFIQMADGTW